MIKVSNYMSISIWCILTNFLFIYLMWFWDDTDNPLAQCGSIIAKN